MQSVKVIINDVQYPSRSAAARALVADGQDIADVARAVGMTYQTVFNVTKGSDNDAARRTKYRAMRLATSKREYTLAFIAQKVGMNRSTLCNMLKRKGVVPTGVKAKTKKIQNADAMAIAIAETAQA